MDFLNIICGNIRKQQRRVINICDICHRTPCHPQCPNAPPLKVIGHCTYCNKPIYEDDFYIKDVYGYKFCCEDCLISQYNKEGLIDLVDHNE